MKLTVRKGLALSLAAAGLMGLCLALPGRGRAQANAAAGVPAGIPRGTYAFSNAGYNVDSSGNLIPNAVAGWETFFANGTTRGVTSTAVKGQAVQRRGTYTGNPDGTVSETVTYAQGVVLHFDDFPTPDGNTVAYVQTDAGAIASGVYTRGSLERY